MQNKYTIQDIARHAGVGATTVSRVLNDHPYVSEATRQKVLDAIAELEYRPSFSARQMRTRSSRLIGFLTDEVITTPYAVHMIKGAEEALWTQDKMLLVVSVGYDMQKTEAAIEVLLERQVEGIVYAAFRHRPVQLPDNITRVPAVLADCFAVDQSLPAVVPDEVQGGFDATTFLLKKGHRRIGFINLGRDRRDGGNPEPAAMGRLQGYKQALADYDVAFAEGLLRYTDGLPQTNYHLALEIMQQPDPPTAIFCGNDRTAMGCYGALQSLNLRIPDDVAVIGFDNHIEFAEYLWPPLTTMQLPHYEMGKWAIDYLAQVAEAGAPPIQHRLPCPLVERASV
jgi:LacI family transcriptional regulator